MERWLQKIVLTVVAVVPVIVGEIVRVTDDAPAEDVILVEPRPDALDPGMMQFAPLEMEPALDGSAFRHGCS